MTAIKSVFLGFAIRFFHRQNRKIFLLMQDVENLPFHYCEK
jgi:hypothetical protein